MQTPPLLRSFVSALVMLLLGVSAASGQDFGQWARIVSFRPESKLQEKLQNVAADENGARPHFLKIEHARGPLLLITSSLVVNKMPAVEGKVLGVTGLTRYLRMHLPDMADGTKFALSYGADTQKSVWEGDSALGHSLKWTDKIANTESEFYLADVSSDRWIFTMLSRSKEAQPHMMSGNVQISVTSASPVEGCVIQVRAAVRPTMAPTAADEWNAAETFARIWIDILENTRKWVKNSNGDCIPELLPPTVSMVPWNQVAKPFHQPGTPWVGIEGTWVSSDKRFRLEFQNESVCEFIETNKSGKEARVTCAVTRGEGEKLSYIIERPNDNDDILTFYEFSAAVRTAIKDRKPEPSRLTLSRNSKGKLIGQWYGLAVTRDSLGNLKDIKPPAATPPRLYEFTPVGD